MLGEQEGSKTCVREKMKRMRIEHGWSESSALERILIERIVATWLDLYFAELVCNQWKGGSIPEGEYKQHRIDRSHRRHLSTVKMLATVRKIALPLQVDITAEINLPQPRRRLEKLVFESSCGTRQYELRQLFYRCYLRWCTDN